MSFSIGKIITLNRLLASFWFFVSGTKISTTKGYKGTQRDKLFWLSFVTLVSFVVRKELSVNNERPPLLAVFQNISVS